MNNKEIREFIIYNMEQGKTPEEVSFMLEDKGVHKTKSAVYSVYKRYTDKKSKEVIQDSKEKDEVAIDVLNIYARGFSIKETTEIYNNMCDKSLGYYGVRKIIIDGVHGEIFEDVLNTLVVATIRMLSAGEPIEAIKNKLKYRGVDVKSKHLNIVISVAYNRILRNYVMNLAADAYELTGNNEVVKSILAYPNKDNAEITLQEVKKRVREK